MTSTARPRRFSSGCLSTELEPVEEFHPPTSGVTALNSSESERRQSNCATSSPRLARSTMVRSDSTDADGIPYPIFKEMSLLSLPFDQEAVHRLWRAVSQSDCMADIRSACQAAGFPKEVTNVLLASWSQ